MLYDQPLLRKLYRMGHSHALGIAGFWIREHLPAGTPYVTVTYRIDGTIVITPDVATTLNPDALPPTPHQHQP